MKTLKSDLWRVTSGVMDMAGVERSRHPSRVTRHSYGFTLIELLTVISIIGILAALLFPVLGMIKRQQYIKNATAEMAQLETAIDRYHAAYGFYPPDNAATTANNLASSLTNQLYFELLGTTVTNTSGTPSYQSLDDPTIRLIPSDVMAIFGVNGFMNCTKPGSGEDAPAARNFLPGLKPGQISPSYTNNEPDPFKMLITSVGGPDTTYKPLGQLDMNPWRYNSSHPVNNPGAYDLWVQLSISGKTNLICNWNKQLSSPLP